MQLDQNEATLKYCSLFEDRAQRVNSKNRKASMSEEMATMRKQLACGVLVLLSILSTTSFGALDDCSVYFLNGMWNSPDDAIKSRDKLHALVIPDVPYVNIQRLYNSNDTALWEMIDVVRRQSTPDSERETFKSFWRFLDDPTASDQLSGITRQQYLEILARYDQSAYVQNPQLQGMVAILRDNYYNKKRKALLVAHSQGNFYANQLVNYLQSFDPMVAACTTVVGVASPATYVAKSGPYQTRSDDAVINLAREKFPAGPSILPANWIPPYPGAFADISSHKFIESYLAPPDLRSRIRSNVLSQASANGTSECALNTPACGLPINSGGGTGTYDFAKTLGAGKQTVTANFEAYGIPDKLEIFAGGRRLASTDGLVSGFHNLTFEFDSAALGTTQLTARVTGNPDLVTAWKLCLDCSGIACGWVSDTRTVTVGYTSTETGGWQCTSGTVSISGQAMIGTIPKYGTRTAEVVAGGKHKLQSVNSACACTYATGCTSPAPQRNFSISYKDGTGVNHSWTIPVALTTTFLFEVK